MIEISRIDGRVRAFARSAWRRQSPDVDRLGTRARQAPDALSSIAVSSVPWSSSESAATRRGRACRGCACCEIAGARLLGAGESARSWPKSWDSSSDCGMAPQLTETNGPSRLAHARCITWRARSCRFPVSRESGLGAGGARRQLVSSRSTFSRTALIPGLLPISSPEASSVTAISVS